MADRKQVPYAKKFKLSTLTALNWYVFQVFLSISSSSWSMEFLAASHAQSDQQESACMYDTRSKKVPFKLDNAVTAHGAWAYMQPASQ